MTAPRRAGAAVPIVALALAVGLGVGLGGCGRGGESADSGRDTLFTDAAFLPPVGVATAHAPLHALYAPGGQQATAWLPDGTFWNGDFEIAFTDSAGTPAATLPMRQGLHADLPAARRAFAGLWVHAFLPWSGADTDTAGWTRLSVALEPAKRITLALRSGGATAHPLHPYAPIAEDFAYDARLEASGREARLLRDGRTLAFVRVHSGGRGTVLRPGTIDPSARHAPDRRVGLVTAVADTGRVVLDVWLAPVGGAAADAAPPDRARSFASSAERTAAAWRAEREKGATFAYPEPRVDAALRNAQRLLVGNRERRGGAVHFLGSPFQYRDLYLRDGARVVQALALLGRADLAGQALASLFEFQWPGGAFLSQRGQLDGTGQALWALGAYAALGGDPKLVDRLLDPALRGARWIAVQRGSAMLRGGPAAGLLPYADPRDNELARGHLFGNDAWAIAGLEALGPLLRARGRAATADTVDAEVRAHRAALLAAWDAAARRQGRPLPPVLEGGGRDWGNLSAAYPCGVLAAEDARVLALDGWLRARRTRDGLLTYGATDSLHHYLGFDRTQAALRRGDRPAFLADLAAILDHAQPDGSGHELIARDGGFGENLPPHGTFAAMFVDLVRSAAAYERGDSLVLLAGAPANLAGVQGADSLVVRRAPTRLGALDLVVKRAGDGAILEATLPAPARVMWPPPGRVAAVTGDGGASRPVAAGVFTLPAGKGTWRVTFEPADGEAR